MKCGACKNVCVDAGHWVLSERVTVDGDFGLTCSKTCREKGMECWASEASRLTSKEEVSAAFQEVNITCFSYTSNSYGCTPDVSVDRGECHFMADGGHSDCDAESFLGSRRLCACHHTMDTVLGKQQKKVDDESNGLAAAVAAVAALLVLAGAYVWQRASRSEEQ